MGRNRPPRRPGARPPGLARVHPDTGGVRADSVSRDEKGRRGDRIAGLARHGGYTCRRLGFRPPATAHGPVWALGGRGADPPGAPTAPQQGSAWWRENEWSSGEDRGEPVYINK